MQEGLRGPQVSADLRNGYSDDLLDDIPFEKLKDKTYTSKKYFNTHRIDNFFDTIRPKELFGLDGLQNETLKVRIPYGAINEVDNPELRGAKNKSEFFELTKKRLNKKQRAEFESLPEFV